MIGVSGLKRKLPVVLKKITHGRLETTLGMKKVRRYLHPSYIEHDRIVNGAFK